MGNEFKQIEHQMGALAAARTAVNPKPLLDLIAREGGECSFADALRTFVDLGMTASQARDALWRLLSDGTIEFTTDRRITTPAPRVLDATG